jgi:hypothetical protein
MIGVALASGPPGDVLAAFFLRAGEMQSAP